MNKHIFVTHTAFQEFIAEASAMKIKKQNINDKVILASEYKLTASNENIWDEVVQLNNISPSSFGKKKENAYNENVIKLCELTKNTKHTTLYISDIQWPLNNRLYFDKKNKKKFDFNMIIDGTLAYYNPQKNLFSALKDVFKYAAGIAGFGIIYRPYLGSVMGWERKNIKKIYGINLKLSPIASEKHMNIDNEIQQSGILDKNKAIFLDQPYHNNTSNAHPQSLIVDTLKFLKEKIICDTYYKPHHFSKEDNRELFKLQKIKLIETNECIEKIISAHGFGIIISYNSTALFTLKSIYKENIKCISLRDKKSRIQINEKNAKRIDSLFYKSGVEIHEIG